MAPQTISPFDPAASVRLQRMGLFTADGQINTSAVEAVSVMQAGLLYTQILDACGDWDSTRNVCRRITSQAAQVADRQVLLIISIQYDTIAKPLPEVIWWISGSDALLAPFVRGFVHHLNELCAEENSREGGNVM